MNEHILLVMKWLDDPESVSQKERDRNRERAAADFSASSYAAVRAAMNDPDSAIYWVDRYFKETSEDKQEYLKALSGKPLPQFKASILSSRPSTVYNEARKGPVIVQRCSTNSEVKEEYVVISKKLWDKGVK